MNMSFSLRFFSVSLVALFAFAASSFAGWEKGQHLPELSGFGLVGEIPELAGKVTYVDFWASWCPPCKASFPEMERLSQEYKAAGFQVLAVSVDSKEKAMTKFLDRSKPSFSTVWDSAQSLVASAEVEVMPTSFLVDGEGVIRAVHYGWKGGETVEKLEGEIQELLGEIKE